MKNIILQKPCHICHCRIKDDNTVDTLKMIPTPRRTITAWYGLCDGCLDRYPELIKTFERISDLYDDVGDCNHTIMFNLIDSIKIHYWGNRYIKPYDPKKYTSV